MKKIPPHRSHKRVWIAPALLMVGLLITGIFGLRTYHQWDHARKVESGEIRVESLRGWMTLPYIAQAHQVPEARIRQVLGLPASGNADRSLRVWFAVSGIDPEAGRLKLEELLIEEGSKTQPVTP